MKSFLEYLNINETIDNRSNNDYFSHDTFEFEENIDDNLSTSGDAINAIKDKEYNKTDISYSDARIIVLDAIIPNNPNEDKNGVYDSLKSKFKDINVIKLYQLNIQPLSEDKNVIDGMVQIESSLKEVDGVIIITDVKKGTIDFTLKNVLDRLNNTTKMNIVFGSIISGEDFTNVKKDLLLFANNNNMITGGTIHSEDTISNFIECFNMLITSTKDLRTEKSTDSIQSFSEFTDSNDELKDEYNPDEKDVDDVNGTEEFTEFDLTQPDLYTK